MAAQLTIPLPRRWMRGAVVSRKHADGDWCLALSNGRVIALPKTYTFTAEQAAGYARMMFGAGW